MRKLMMVEMRTLELAALQMQNRCLKKLIAEM